MMRNSLMLAIRSLFCILVLVSSAQATNYKIGIFMWHESVHDEQALNGLKEGIELSGIAYEFDLKRAYGDKNKGREFLRKWKEQEVDLICTIGTKGTLWAMEEIKDIPIVFTAVTNPVASGIADSWDSSGRNVTGSSNWIKGKYRMTLFREGIPSINTLGIIYNPNNPVSTAEVSCARECAKEAGITIKVAAVNNVEQISGGVADLINQGIDALWVPIEELVYKNMTQVSRVTLPANLPVVSSTEEPMGDLVEEGSVSIIAVTVDYRSLGRACVPSAIQILTSGKDPKEIPIQVSNHRRIVINVNASKAIDLKIPPTFLAKADKVYKGFSGSKIIVGGTGDSQKLLRVMAKSFEQKLGGGKIVVPESIGSGGGIRAVASGVIDLARIARPIKENERKLKLTSRVFAKSPIVFVVHPSVTGVENLTFEQIVGIYSGQIKSWGELGGKDQKIYAVTREPGDSSLIVLNSYIPGFKDTAKSAAAKVIYSTPEAVGTLTHHRKTIGFLPLAMTIGTNLRILKVEGNYPSVENVKTGRYELTIPLGIAYKDQLKPLAKIFIDFLYSKEGRLIISEYGAIPE